MHVNSNKVGGKKATIEFIIYDHKNMGVFQKGHLF